MKKLFLISKVSITQQLIFSQLSRNVYLSINNKVGDPIHDLRNEIYIELHRLI